MPTKRHRHEGITRINSKVARDINRSIILNTVRRRQPISRAEISQLTRLNKSTVSSIVAGLVDEDLLLEQPDQSNGIGRTPVNLSVKRGKHYVGAVFFDAPCARVAIVDIDGTVKAREEVWIKAGSPKELVAECIARLNGLRSTIGPHQFHGIGATVAGIVDSAQSEVVYAANLGWNHLDLSALIRQEAPEVEAVSVENDAKASALAELILGKHHLTSTNLVFLLLAGGIGAGIVVNGKILSGNAHAAGEVGHMTVVDGGEQCPCGNKGCWELYASERAPVRWLSQAKNLPTNGQTSGISALMEASRAGDADALKALHLWAHHIGVGIGDLISILDPEVVIVGGSITPVWDLVQEDINSSARGSGKFSKQRTTTILPTSLQDNPPLVGAAALTIRRIFADYSISL